METDRDLAVCKIILGKCVKEKKTGWRVDCENRGERTERSTLEKKTVKVRKITRSREKDRDNNSEVENFY